MPDLTNDVSPGGDSLTKVTYLRDDQTFESWLWASDFLEWYASNFAIEEDHRYEFVTIVDTVWDPTEYSGGTTVFSGCWQFQALRFILAPGAIRLCAGMAYG